MRLVALLAAKDDARRHDLNERDRTSHGGDAIAETTNRKPKGAKPWQ
jgi:hypothetical protein